MLHFVHPALPASLLVFDPLQIDLNFLQLFPNLFFLQPQRLDLATFDSHLLFQFQRFNFLRFQLQLCFLYRLVGLGLLLLQIHLLLHPFVLQLGYDFDILQFLVLILLTFFEQLYILSPNFHHLHLQLLALLLKQPRSRFLKLFNVDGPGLVPHYNWRKTHFLILPIYLRLNQGQVVIRRHCVSFGLNTVDRTHSRHLLPGHPVAFPRGLWLGHYPAHHFLADGKFALGLVGSLPRRRFGCNLLHRQRDVGGEGLVLDLVVLFEKILVFPVEDFCL